MSSESTQQLWGSSEDENVTFTDNGALEVNGAVAATAGENAVSVSFENDPSINSGLITSFALDSGNSYVTTQGTSSFPTHIYAYGDGNGVASISLSNDNSSLLLAGVAEGSLRPYAIAAKYAPHSYAGAATVVGKCSASTSVGQIALVGATINLGSGNAITNNILVAWGGNYQSGATFSGSATAVVGTSLNARNNTNYSVPNAGLGNSASISGGKWTVGDYNTFIAYSEGTKDLNATTNYYFASSAAVLGASCVSSYNQGDSGHGNTTPSYNKCRATVYNVDWDIGNHNRMEAYAGGYCTPLNSWNNAYYYGATATVLGASCSLGGGGGSGPAEIADTTVTMGNYNNLVAYGSAASAIIGASCDSVHKGCAAIVTLQGTGGLASPEQKSLVPFVWTMGDYNTFKSYSGFSATVIGASCNSGDPSNWDQAVVVGGQWNIGNNNVFEAYSGSASAVLGSSYKSGNEHGFAGVGAYAQDGRSSNGNESTTTSADTYVEWNVGNNNIFISATNGPAVVFGSSANDSNNSTGGTWAMVTNALWHIGGNNTLAASAHYMTIDPAYLLFETKPQNNGHQYAIASVLGASCDSSNGRAEMSRVELMLGDGNSLTASASTGTVGGSVASANVIGAATRSGGAVANNITLNMNGSQTLAAVAYSSGTASVDTIGAMSTDKGTNADDFGWRVGIFADDSVASNSTVNILGAVLESDWAIDGGTATATLSTHSEARAFAIGDDFQIYIGGRADADSHAFTPVMSSIDTNNVVNIIGMITEARSPSTTRKYRVGSGLTVAEGWTANTYGSVSCLEAITVGNATSSGNLRLYNTAEHIHKIELVSGQLHIGHSGSGDFDAIIGNLKNSMVYVDPNTGIRYGGKLAADAASETNPNTLDINATSYTWNGTNSSGCLTLESDERLIFHVDSSQPDPAFAGTSFADQFRLVKGFVTADPDMIRIRFLGGKIAIMDDSPANATGVLPDSGKYWIIRSTDTEADATDVISSRSLLAKANEENGIALDAEEVEDLGVRGAVYQVTGDDREEVLDLAKSSGAEDFGGEEAQAASENPYTEIPDIFNLYISDEDYGGAVKNGYRLGRGIYLSPADLLSYLAPDTPPDGGPDTPPDGGIGGGGDFPSAPTLHSKTSHAVELANINMGAISIFRDTLDNRMTDVKGNGNDPFLIMGGSYARKGIANGGGYKNNLGGIVGGFDYVYQFDEEENDYDDEDDQKKESKDRYLRLGIAGGYFRGKSNFTGPIAYREKISSENIYAAAVFAAYEAFNSKKLKTDINLFAGFEYAKNEISRIDENEIFFHGSAKSNILFAYFECIKNLFRRDNWQFGPWVFIKYHYVTQDGYDDVSDDNPAKSQRIGGVKFDFLDTILGCNIEYEHTSITDYEYFGNKEQNGNNARGMRLFFRGGLGIQPIRKCSIVDHEVDTGEYPMLRYPPKRYAMVVAGFREKFDEHWELAGSWKGTFGKNFAMHVVTLGVGYNF
ncbi:MAG: hypothetical protein LBB16_01950 [Puniceicoccales bacterium]|jgi:hypothetical protein|nr:hypothetical protein [Puniceicoccales bacterium]